MTNVEIISIIAIIISAIAAVISGIAAICTVFINKRQIREQKEQFDETIRKQEEHFERTIEENKEIERIKERPYLIIKSYEADNKTKELIINFKNKGNGTAFCVALACECFERSISDKNICLIERYDAIDDAIIMVGESLKTYWKIEKENGAGKLAIEYKDASNRSYKQEYSMIISNGLDIKIPNYAVPILIKK